MVKRCYIQDYPENFRANTETRTIASDFIWLSIKDSLTRREILTKKKEYKENRSKSKRDSIEVLDRGI